MSIPKEIALADLNMDTAVMLLSLPRDLGLHPETNKKIVANLGRFGPYVNHDGKFKSIPKSQSVFSIDLAGAVNLLAQASSGPAPIKELGEHPTEGGSIAIYAGRYGPYVQHGKVRATLTKSHEPEDVTLEEALELISAKAAKDALSPPKTGGRKAAAKKATIKKVVAKKAVTKKVVTTDEGAPVAKKATVKKATPKRAVVNTAAKKPAIKKSVAKVTAE